MFLKIHWLCNSPSPYNDYLFRNLNADSNINLTVHFKEKNVASHPWSEPLAQGFQSRYYNKFLGLDWEIIKIAIREKGIFFVVAGWNHPVQWIVMSILKFRKLPFAIWTDTPNLEKRRMWLMDILRTTWLTIIFRSAYLILGTGSPCVKALQLMGVPHDKIINFPCWVLLPNKTENRRNINKDGRIIFFSIGRLADIKGYDLTIKAIDIVVKNYSKDMIEYWIFGDGPERKTLDHLVKEKGLDKIIKFWGWKEPAFIQDKINEADVLVHPALWEPYGVAVLEAMALGKPAICSNKTMAAIDRITPTENGLIHRAGDIEQLAKHLSYFIENPDQVETMGAAARCKAQEWPVERGVEIIKNIVRINNFLYYNN